MGTLRDLPNIGQELEKHLLQVGISSPEELERVGTENAFIKINALDASSCFSKLMAIEGAIQGIRWHNIDKTRKKELEIFFHQLKNQ